MREETFKVYEFHELSPEAQAKALENNRYAFTDYDWWHNVYDSYLNDKKELSNNVIEINNITGFDICAGTVSLIYGVNMQLIRERFGEKHPCIAGIESYSHLFNCDTDEKERAANEIEAYVESELEDLKTDLIIDLQEEYEHLTNDETIVELFNINGYEFLSNGETFNLGFWQ